MTDGRWQTLVWLALCSWLVIGCSSAPTPPTEEPATVDVAPVVETLSEADIRKIGTLYGPMAEARVRLWQKIILDTDSQDDLTKLQQVNRFFNGARFVNDMVAWQQKDYWATPLEFIIRDAGDCEDFSVAKYFTLEKMGIEPEKMRLTFVRADTLNKAHMVLSYYPQPGAEPLILDNIELQILPASKRQDLRPVYSFNGEDLWLSRTRTQQQKAGKADTIKHWQQLKIRRAQGVPLLPFLMKEGVP